MTRTITLVGYAGIAVAAVAVEVGARRRGGARLSQVLTSSLAHRPVRLALLLAAWLWVGWHVFVRVDWR